jgi:hypothetical protein
MRGTGLFSHGFRVGSFGGTPRLTYRRRGGRWSAKTISELSCAAERKARVAVRCRRIVWLCCFHGFVFALNALGAMRRTSLESAAASVWSPSLSLKAYLWKYAFA